MRGPARLTRRLIEVAQGVALAGLALVTVLPEYAVDIYYTLRAGAEPGSDGVQFAAANMTGANRLLIGVGWPLIAVLYWVRSRRQVVPLQPTRRAWRTRRSRPGRVRR